MRRLWLLLVAMTILAGLAPLSTPAQAAATPSFVQAVDGVTRSGNTVSVSFRSPTTSGNLILAYVIWSNTASVSISDSQRNVYQSAVGPTGWRGNAANAQIFYAKNVGGGATTLTATFVAPITTFGILYIHEYSGLDPTNPVDVTSAASGTSNPLNSGSLTTANSTDLLFGAGASDNAVSAPASPFRVRSTAHANVTADANVTATGTYHFSATHNGTAWVIQLVALRAASTSGSPTPTATPTSSPTSTYTPTPTGSGPTATPTPIPAQGAPAYPLKMSANHRYLVDQNNAPFLMVGDSPQAMVGNITLADADLFLANRQAAGFNAMWINLLCTSYTACRSDSATFDGIPPFTTLNDLSTPNEAYFSKVDRVVQLAANHGQVVLLDPIETGGWTGVAVSNGTTKAYNYGKYLGQRYKSFPNIIWMSGNDFQSWGNSTNDAAIRAVAQGIKDNDPAHIQTIELNYYRSGSLDDPSWAPLVSLSAVYTYYPTFDQVLKEYNRNAVPVFMVEANYDGEHNFSDQGTPQILRRQEYWTLLSGATGQLFGNHFTWQFASGWKSNMDTPSSNQMKFVTGLFGPRQWYNLVPDQTHSFVTAGFGTYDANTSLGNSSYVTSARTADGSLGIAYMPTLRTLTVDMTRLSGSATARWYDPSRGTYVAIAGSPFANTGTRQFTPPSNNADGAGDWVLVLETASQGGSPVPTTTPTRTPVPGSTSTPTPVPPTLGPNSSSPTFVQVNSAAPQTSQTAVGVTFTQPQVAGDTNVLAIGWNDSTSNIASVADSRGNTYQVAAPVARGAALSQAIYYAKNITGATAGANTVTVTFSGAVAFPDVRILEYGGLDTLNPLDVSASASGSGSSAASGNATTTTPRELIVGAGMTTGAFSGAGGQFTIRVITQPDGDIAEDRTVAATGAYSATAPVSGSWVMQMATFR